MANIFEPDLAVQPDPSVMRATSLIVGLASLMAGCLGATASPQGFQTPENVCAKVPSPWPIMVDETERTTEANRTRLTFAFRTGNQTRRLSDVQYALRWGPNDQESHRDHGTMDELVGGARPWRLDDASPVGWLGADDRLVLRLPSATSGQTWAVIDLASLEGVFLGGTARCA
jgi:hypothetical protein